MTAKEDKFVDKAEMELSYKAHSKIIGEVKEAYRKAFETIFDQISHSDFDQFSQILSDKAEIDLNAEELIDEIKPTLIRHLNIYTDNFFAINDVEHKLIALEMLKEKCKDREGTDWNIPKMTPEEFALSIRVRVKEFGLNILKKQLNKQNKELAAIHETNQIWRERVLNINSRRVSLQDLMKTKFEDFKELKPKLLELQKQLNEALDCVSS